MDKLDFMHLQEVNSNGASRASKAQVASDTPLPPFGSLSFDLARMFVRGMQKRGHRFDKSGRQGAGARPKTSSSAALGKPASTFSPMAEYAKQEPIGDVSYGAVKPVFSSKPTLPTAPAYSIRLRPNTSTATTKAPTPSGSSYRTAKGFQLLSTSKSAPLPSFGTKGPKDSASNPHTLTATAGIGVTHADMTKLGGPGGWTLAGRRKHAGSEANPTPGPYTWQDDAERARSTKNEDPKVIRMGIRLRNEAETLLMHRSPGPASVNPKSDFGTKPVSMGTRHSHLDVKYGGHPGPAAYDSLRGAKASKLRRAPAFTMAPRLTSGEPASTANEAPLLAFQKGIRKSRSSPAFTPLPKQARAPAWTMGDRKPEPSKRHETPDPAMYDPEPGLAATLRSKPKYSFGVKTKFDSAVLPSENAGNPSIGLMPKLAPRPVTFGIRHKHLEGKPDATPGPYSYQDDHERQRSTVRTRQESLTHPKFGTKLASSITMHVDPEAPGPAHYAPASPIGKGVLSFGEKHKHLDFKPTASPGPVYNTGPACAASRLRRAPAFTFAPSGSSPPPVDWSLSRSGPRSPLAHSPKQRNELDADLSQDEDEDST